MARLSVDYFSAALMRTTTLDVILPIDNTGEAYGADYERRHDASAWDRRDYPRTKGPFKTLYLLHGITGNHTDLISETRIRAWAEERRIAVVMPSGYNAFYLDHPETHNYYGRFVGEELLDVTRSMFPLSDRREDTFIGGVSMGAYGAMRNGLKYCENFGSIISLSTAMVIDGFDQIISDGLFFLERSYLESIFGDLNQVVGSDKDPARLAADPVRRRVDSPDGARQRCARVLHGDRALPGGNLHGTSYAKAQNRARDTSAAASATADGATLPCKSSAS